MMYQSNETDPRLRYKSLSNDQLQAVDDYVIRLLQGSAHEPADFYKLKKENESLKAKLDLLQNTGFEQIMKQIQQQIQGLGVNVGGASSGGFIQTGGSGMDQAQLNRLIQDNEKLR